MTVKELVMYIIVGRVSSLEEEIEKLEEILADKKKELETLKLLETKNDFED